MPLEVNLGDIVTLRKPHPCGGFNWIVVRLGTDIGLVCTTCGRRVLLPRSIFEKRVRWEIPGNKDAARDALDGL